MRMFWLLALAAIAMGGLLSVQPLINARVAGAAGHPTYGAMFSVFVSTLTLLVMSFVLRLPLPDLKALAAGPAWTWTGGVIGAFVVLTALTATPRLGAATTVMLFITGQMMAALILDHNGWLGVPVHPIDLPLILGVLCLVAGIVLIRWV
jgi:transporter family-2 protein